MKLARSGSLPRTDHDARFATQDITGIAVDSRKGKRTPRAGNDDERHIGRERRRPMLRENSGGACRTCVGNELKSVGLGPRHCDEKIAGLHLATVDGDAGNVLGREARVIVSLGREQICELHRSVGPAAFPPSINP